MRTQQSDAESAPADPAQATMTCFTPLVISHARTRSHESGSSLFQQAITAAEIGTRVRRWGATLTISFAKSVGLSFNSCSSCSVAPSSAEPITHVWW